MARWTLGDFLLDRPIQQGGMGRVWAGVHRPSGTGVALKVLDPASDDPRARSALRSEIRAMVALEHPRIVRVLDELEVDEASAAASDSALPAGAPVLVMDLAESDLNAAASALDWADTTRVLSDVLDALAHAHARGVVHRDLKPANVLIDREGRYALTDFGLAQVDVSNRAEAPLPGGTPAFMAPEQVEQRWRDTGPWTDLYSLGMLTWALVSGTPPFTPQTPAEARRMHVHTELPAFRPKLEVPAGLEAWLRRLLAKDPSHRFQRAADAAWSLQRLVEPKSWISPHPDPSDHDTPMPGPRLEHTWTTLRWDHAPEDLPPPVVEGGMASMERPPMPSAPPPPPPQNPPPPGMGESLAGIRPVPFVGRAPERARLWEELGRVQLMGGARLVLVEGASGFGKTRLVHWLAESAHASGAATVLHASHASIPGPATGLGPMVARHLRCFGLRGSRLLARVQGLLRRQGVRDPREWQGLAELIAPGEGPARFNSAREWYVLVLRLVERLCRQRPVILALDDVQWGGDALGLVRELFSGRWGRLPVLVVLTARTDVLPDRPGEAKLLERCVDRAEGERIHLGPLSLEEQGVLLSCVLGDDPDAEAIAEHAGGHPLLAVQLARDHLQHGGSDVADLDGVWAARIRHVLEGRSTDDHHALELAAALGVEIDAEEWRDACALADLSPTADLVDAMLDAELAVAGDEGSDVLWSFAHGGLRDRLEHQALEGDGARWRRWNQAIADMLAPRGALAGGRRGQHLLAAGAPDDAADSLLAGAQFLLDRGDARAELLLDQAEAALSRLDTDDDPRHVELLVQRTHVARFLLDADQLYRLADEARTLGDRHGWPELQARAPLARGEADRIRTDPESALTHLDQAERLAREHGLPRVLLEALELSAVMHLSQGRVEIAEARAREALELCPAHGDPRTEAFARIGLSGMLLMQERLDEAWEQSQAAHRLFERLHNWEMLAQVLNLEGELLRARGDLSAARAAYEEAIDVLRLQSGDDGSVRFVQLNVALTLIEEERFRDAEPVLWGLLGKFKEDERSSSPVAAAWCQAALLPCLAATRRWPDFDRCLADLQAAIARHQLAERDLARCAARAGGLARRAGRAERARPCWELARSQYSILGNTEEEQRIAAALAALPEPEPSPTGADRR